MSDRPWLEDSDPSLRTERALLKRLNAAQPPSGSIDHGWAALAAEIAVLPVIGVSVPNAAHVAAHAAKLSLGFGLGAKIAVGVVVASSALLTGSAWLKPAQAPNETPSQHLSAPTESPTERPLQAPSIAPEESADADEPPAKALPTRPPNSATTLAEEGRLLAKANQLVQAGQAQAALEVLRASAARYPRSVLYQEREVLTVEALAATGASGAAKSRAERFLKRYPSSPHIGRLKRFVE